MNTFLHYVAQDILDKYGYNLSRIAVVFPRGIGTVGSSPVVESILHHN